MKRSNKFRYVPGQPMSGKSILFRCGPGLKNEIADACKKMGITQDAFLHIAVEDLLLLIRQTGSYERPKEKPKKKELNGFEKILNEIRGTEPYRPCIGPSCDGDCDDITCDADK